MSFITKRFSVTKTTASQAKPQVTPATATAGGPTRNAKGKGKDKSLFLAYELEDYEDFSLQPTVPSYADFEADDNALETCTQDAGTLVFDKIDNEFVIVKQDKRSRLEMPYSMKMYPDDVVENTRSANGHEYCPFQQPQHKPGQRAGAELDHVQVFIDEIAELDVNGSMQPKNLDEELIFDAEDELASLSPVVAVNPVGVAEQFALLRRVDSDSGFDFESKKIDPVDEMRKLRDDAVLDAVTYRNEAVFVDGNRLPFFCEEHAPLALYRGVDDRDDDMLFLSQHLVNAQEFRDTIDPAVFEDEDDDEDELEEGDDKSEDDPGLFTFLEDEDSDEEDEGTFIMSPVENDVPLSPLMPPEEEQEVFSVH